LLGEIDANGVSAASRAKQRSRARKAKLKAARRRETTTSAADTDDVVDIEAFLFEFGMFHC
jgi:hypothetical protein